MIAPDSDIIGPPEIPNLVGRLCHNPVVFENVNQMILDREAFNCPHIEIGNSTNTNEYLFIVRQDSLP